jgi:MYXO-CTERM domain-containing protein
MYNVSTPSNIQGAAGGWPDAMIPAVDEIDNQARNAFPVDVAANTQQPVFVEYHVPEGAAAGWYTGTVHVTGGIIAEVPVKLYVHAFSLPSTSSLPSAYGIGSMDPCTAHYGGYQQCGADAGVEQLNTKYTKFALDHRISLSEVVYTGPLTNADGSYDWATWDAKYSPMLDGGMNGRLLGAKLTSVRYMWTNDQAHYAEWAKHFRAKGWFDRTFDYSCDEPPNGCSWASINARTSMVHAADPGFQTLVTTTLAEAQQQSVLAGIDILVPNVMWLDPMPPLTNLRPTYDAWLGGSAQKKMWIYQACDSDGCGDGGDASQSGWPTHMIDAPATQNRAMEWQAWRQKAAGELYYDTTYAFPRGDTWTSQYYFGGNGDGTLFYPGTPAKIGGTSHIPIASLRVKLIREGMEDYEYLHLADTLGAGDDARATVAALFPAAWQVTQATPAKLYAARAHLADLIEAKLGHAPPPVAIAHADAPVDLHGDGPAFAAATPITVGAGAASATFRMLWDDSALYIAADVADAQLSVIGTGHDGELWDADGVELLLDPLRERTASADAGDRHLIVTAAGDELEARGAGAGEDRSFVIGATTVVTTQGSVGGSTPATGYRVVAAIPWSGLGVTPAAGLVLGADLALNDLDGTQLTSGDWAGITPFAQPIRWNALVLAASGDGATPSDGLGGNGATTGNDGTSGGAHIRGCAVGADTDAPSWAWIVALAVAAVARRRRRSFVQDVL